VGLKRGCAKPDSLTMSDGEQRPLWRPLPAAPRPSLPHVKSRWLGGTLTFGPAGRIGWTIGLLWLPAWMVYLALVEGLVGIMIAIPVVTTWCCWVIPRFLRDVWAKETVYVPVPWVEPIKLMTTIKGDRIPSIEEWVAEQAQTDVGLQ
jgi:hypothetical protein